IGEALGFSHATRKHQNDPPRKWAKGAWLLGQLTPQAHFSPTRKREDPSFGCVDFQATLSSKSTP
ncbi:MAG TPA: hypothetical protein VFC44_20990, partial [Candidatus Saccharimonadales bacterium]|nr:hypothetical protein [Candidatus Saccharimonadales bacterium]